MMSQNFFITGTDTDVGKTWVTIALMRYFQQQGETVLGMKPVAAGCQLMEGELRNDDALLMQKYASMTVPYPLMNPYRFELAVSPHIAAHQTDVIVEIKQIINAYQQLAKLSDKVLVEGAGGWFAPLTDNLTIEDLALALKLPVILVVAIRLGCINHARLTHQAIINSGLSCTGWIAVSLDKEMSYANENIKTIEQSLSAPLLGVLPYQQQANFDELARCFAGENKVL